MRRFDDRRNARTPTGVTDPFAAVLGLSPYSFLDAETYTVDGVSGKVASFVDRVNPGTGIRAITADHNIFTTNSAQQFDLPSADAAFNNAVVGDIPSGVRFYTSNSAASSWKCFIDGTGYQQYSVVSQLNTTATTNYLISLSNSAINPFATIWRNGTTLFSQITNDTITIASPSASGGSTSPYIFQTMYQEGYSPTEVNIRAGSGAWSGVNTAAAPTANSPTRAFSMFALGSGGSGPWFGKWACTIIFNRILTTDEDATVRAYILAKYGV